MAKQINLSQYYLKKSEIEQYFSAGTAKAIKDEIDKKINTTDIQNNLTSTSTNKPLSANMGEELKGLVDGKAPANHTHSQYLTEHQTIPVASTSQAGISQLSSATNSTSETTAATSKAVKTTYDLANGKPDLGTTATTAAKGNHTHSQYLTEHQTIPTASTSQAGITQLSSATNSTSETTAATSKAVKTAYDLANGKPNLGTTSTTAAKGDHTHSQYLTSVPTASTTQAGITQLNTATNSTSTTEAATPSAVKAAYDLANGKANSSHTHSLEDIVLSDGTDGMDFNTYKTQGLYRVWYSWQANNSNKPLTAGGLLKVETIPNGCTQTFYVYGENNQIYYRTYYTPNDVWNAWIRIDGQNKIDTSAIKNDLTTGGATNVLSAEQGKQLKSQLDSLSTSTASSGHTHDDRYYTESEIDAKLTAKNVTLTKLSTPTSGYIATYEVKQGTTSLGKIDIPKDYLVKSGSVKSVTTANSPVSGYVVGDKYIDFVINTKDSSGTDEHIYINVKDLVDVYTHPNSGVTAGTNYNGSQTPAFGANFNIPKLTFNAQGHITASAKSTVKIPNNLGNGTTAGLSTNDYTTTEKTKLSGIATGATKNTVENSLTSTSTTNAASSAAVKAVYDISNPLKKRYDGVYIAQGSTQSTPFYRLFHIESNASDSSSSALYFEIYEITGWRNAKVAVYLRRNNSSSTGVTAEIIGGNWIPELYVAQGVTGTTSTSKSYVDVFWKIYNMVYARVKVVEDHFKEGTYTQLSPVQAGAETYADLSSAATTLYNTAYAQTSLISYTVNANTIKKNGGTSSQFLKADGSVDSNTYLTTGTASSTYLTKTDASNTYQPKGSYLTNTTGSVTSTNIADKTIVNGDIADGTIESGKIKDGTIVNADIANTTIQGGKLANQTVTGTQIANNTIDQTKIKYYSGNGGANTAGYVKILQFKVTSRYQDRPVTFAITQRHLPEPIYVSFKFKNESGTDPTVVFFTMTGGTWYQIGGYPEIYLHKVDTSTWNLLVKKSENYDSVQIWDLHTVAMGITATSQNELLSTLPTEGYLIKCTHTDINASNFGYYISDDFNLYMNIPAYVRSYCNPDNNNLDELFAMQRPLADLTIASYGGLMINSTQSSTEKAVFFPVVNPTSIEYTYVSGTHRGFYLGSEDNAYRMWGFGDGTSWGINNTVVSGNNASVTSTAVADNDRINIRIENDKVSMYRNGTLIVSATIGTALDVDEYFFGFYTNYNRNLVIKDLIIR